MKTATTSDRRDVAKHELNAARLHQKRTLNSLHEEVGHDDENDEHDQRQGRGIGEVAG